MQVMFFYFGNTQKADFISLLVTFWGAWAQGRRETTVVTAPGGS